MSPDHSMLRAAQRVREGARDFLRALVVGLFPPQCTGCEALGAEPLCARCHAATPWFHGPIATTRVAPAAWDRAVAACRFEGPIVEALHRLKYLGRHDVARPLAQLLVPRLPTTDYDVVLPVPLAIERLRERGYNQALLLARWVARALQRPLLFDALQRTRATPPQVGLTGPARLDNVRGAFAVAPRHCAALRGHRLLLIDDVLTTGATLDACARTLRRAGAAHIDVAAVAMA